MQEAEAMKARHEEYAEKWTCKICSSDDIDCVLVPCGHSICVRCSENLTRIDRSAVRNACTCPYCRKVAQVQRFFNN